MSDISAITRVPRESDPERHRRAHDELAGLLNGLVRGGTIVRGGGGANRDPNAWSIAHLLYTGNGPPSEALAGPNDYYLDLVAGVLYLKS